MTPNSIKKKKERKKRAGKKTLEKNLNPGSEHATRRMTSCTTPVGLASSSRRKNYSRLVDFLFIHLFFFFFDAAQHRVCCGSAATAAAALILIIHKLVNMPLRCGAERSGLGANIITMQRPCGWGRKTPKESNQAAICCPALSPGGAALGAGRWRDGGWGGGTNQGGGKKSRPPAASQRKQLFSGPPPQLLH